MKTFYSNHPSLVNRNLHLTVKQTLADIDKFCAMWADVKDSLPGTKMTLEPYHAVYFLGGRSSLVTDLAGTGAGRIVTSDGGKLCIAMVTGINFSSGTKFNSFFKSTFTGKKGLDKRLTVDLNKLKSSSLTVIAVYHADTGGRREPNTTLIERLHDSEITYPTLANRINTMRKQEREETVGNFMEQMNWN